MEQSWWIGLNTPSSKNGRVWTGTYFVASENTQKWRKWTKLQWEIQKESFLEALKSVQKPYKIEFTFIRKSRHKFDYINLCQTIQDEMKFHKWIAEDDADEIKPYFGDYIYDKHNPGCLIKIINL